MKFSRCPVILVAALGACSESPTDPIGDPSVVSVEINPGDLSFASLGVTATLAAVAKDAQGGTVPGTTVAWTTRTGGIISVSNQGVVTAVGNGVDTVVATISNKVGLVEVRVEQVPVDLQLTTPSNTISIVGSSITLTAQVVDANNRTVNGAAIEFSSSNAIALPVSANGIVTAARIGSASIEANSGAFTKAINVAVTLTGPVGGPILGQTTPCVGGMAGPFPCNGVTLLSFLPLGGIGADASIGTDLNDLWGWTDPTTQKEYAIVMRRDGTAFVDVSDARLPIYLGFLPITPGASPNVWHDVKVYQDHAFIVSDGAGPHGMQVFDLRQLRTPSPAPRMFTPNFVYTLVNSVHNIFINENSGFAYLVGSSAGGTTCGGGLHMVDIHTPAAPTFAGCFAHANTGRANTGYTHDVQCVPYAGPDAAHVGKEICFGSNETHLSISNVTNKAAPVALSRTSYPFVAYTHQGWLTEDQRYFLIDDELDEQQGGAATTRTLVWDVSDLDDPVLVKQYFGPTAATDHNQYIRGTRMYSSNYQFGLRVVDVSNPINPFEVGFFDTAPNWPNTPGFGGTWSNYPFFASGIVVMTSRTEGLFVLRVE